MAENTKSKILERLLRLIPSKYRKETGSFVSDIETPVAAEFENAYMAIDDLVNYAFVKNSSGEYLEYKLSEYGFYRKQATYASGAVTVTGEDGAVINTDDLVAAGDVVFKAVETVTLSGTTATVRVRAVVPGSRGNVAAGKVNRFPVTLPNITGVINTNDFLGGADEESDNDFKARFFEAVKNPRTSGNKYHYIEWANEVDGVGGARCYPVWDGPGTVKVVITATDMLPATEELIQRVKDYIETLRPVGASVSVVSAKDVPINVSAAVVLDGGYTIPEVQEQFESRMIEYLKAIGNNGGYVRYSKVLALMMGVSGVEDCTDCKVNGDTENIDIANDEVAVLGGVELVN